jgi:hypothetical protein
VHSHLDTPSLKVGALSAGEAPAAAAAAKERLHHSLALPTSYQDVKPAVTQPAEETPAADAKTAGAAHLEAAPVTTAAEKGECDRLSARVLKG